MIDRASIFADQRMFELLRTKFIPVAIDQAYERRQKDAEGEFYRSIASQGPRKNFQGTTQGFYVATPAGELLLYNNNRDPEKVLRLTKKASVTFAASKSAKRATKPIASGKVDARYNPVPPEGGLVVRVRAKVLGGYVATSDRWRKAMQTALSRDNLWITQKEHAALVAGELPKKLMRRLTRFHLVDNTRGEPPMWQDKEVRKIAFERDGKRIRGSVLLRTEDGKRGYVASMLGFVEVEKDVVTRFDLVVNGEFWGEGRYTRNAPAG
ncbi:MAG TPA: hypothetical protein EYP98_03500, partial [Planctomycetes bacterium]|nr:hypothetical protein [Planctomycetota bacterium]